MRNLINFFIFAALTINFAFGQSKIPNDTLQIGKGSTANDKGLIFNTDDGGSNKTLKVNKTSKSLIWSGNDMQMGDANSSNDKTIVLDPTSGADIRWNGTSNVIESSNDGATYNPVGIAASNPEQAKTRKNVGLAASVAANAMTIALKQADGSTDATAADSVDVGFRSSTITVGGYSIIETEGAISLVIPSGATLGTVSGEESYIYVYGMDNAGTMELAVSLTYFPDETSLISTTVLDASSDNSYDIYSTTARSTLPFRYLGRVISTQATAGTWASSPSKMLVGDTPELQKCRIVDEKADGVNGGTATSGSFQTRDLNLLEPINPGGCSFVTISANAFSLYGGRFYISDSGAPSGNTNNQSCRVRNTSDSLTPIPGSSRQSTSGTVVQIDCSFNGPIYQSSTTAKNYEVQHWVSSTSATTGWGTAGPGGEAERYTSFTLTKIE